MFDRELVLHTLGLIDQSLSIISEGSTRHYSSSLF